eukprot:9491185-Pyramimonas_sp.AAC.2
MNPRLWRWNEARHEREVEGQVVQWCNGTVAQWCNGTVAQWYSGGGVNGERLHGATMRLKKTRVCVCARCYRRWWYTRRVPAWSNNAPHEDKVLPAVVVYTESACMEASKVAPALGFLSMYRQKPISPSASPIAAPKAGVPLRTCTPPDQTITLTVITTDLR